jgi:hypothetical protein
MRESKSGQLTLLDVPLIKLKGKVLPELLDVVLRPGRRSDGRVVAQFDESAEVPVVLCKLVGPIRVVNPY